MAAGRASGALPAMPKTMGISGEGGYESSTGADRDEEQRRLAFAGLAALDVVTDDDEEEISRFRAFVAGPTSRQRSATWLRRRPALPA